MLNFWLSFSAVWVHAFGSLSRNTVVEPRTWSSLKLDSPNEFSECMLCVPPWECSLKQRCGKYSSMLKPWHTFQKTPNFPEHQRISFHPIALIHGREDEYLSVEPGCPNFVPLVCRNTLNLKVSLPLLVPEVHIHLETKNQTWFLLCVEIDSLNGFSGFALCFVCS